MYKLKSNSFISAIQRSKIIASQALGIISEKEDKPNYFLAGILHNVKIIPAAGCSVPTHVEIKFSDYSQYIPKDDKTLVRWVAGEPNHVAIHDHQDSVYPNKDEFVNEMNRLMEKVETKDNFPLFVRNLSKLRNWRPYCTLYERT